MQTAADPPDAGGSVSQTVILQGKTAKSAQRLFQQPTQSRHGPLLRPYSHTARPGCHLIMVTCPQVLELFPEYQEDVYQHLAARAAALHAVRGARILIGIAGVPGSGKSTMAAAICSLLNSERFLGNDQCLVVPMDGDCLGYSCQRTSVLCEMVDSLEPIARAGRQQKRDFGIAVAKQLASASHSITRPAHKYAGGCCSDRYPVLTAGYHYYRAELDAGVAGDPAQAHARRGAHWTFDAPAFVACVRSLKEAGGGHAASGSARNDDGGEPHGDEEEAAVAVPSFAHGVGDPVPDDIRVAARHRVLLVEGNYLLLGEALDVSALPAPFASRLCWTLLMSMRPLKV